MRIVLIGPASPWRGGIAHFNDLLAKEMRQQHQVHVLSFCRQYPSFLFPGKSQKHPSEAALDIGAEDIIDSIGPWSWIKTAKRIRQLNPDLVIFRYWMPFFAPAFACIMQFCRTQNRPHILMLADNIVPHEQRLFDSFLTRMAMRRVDSFLTMATSVRDDLLQLNPSAKVSVHPHPVYDQFGEAIDRSAARAQLAIDDDAELLLYFGFIRHYKGLDILLHAMAELKTSRKIKLLAVGEFYEKENEYRQLVKDKGIEDSVHFVAEYVGNDEVAAYFSAANVVVLPYRHATQSGVIPVAWQMEKPVICTKVGGLAEIVPHEVAGLLVPPEDPTALAQCIRRYFEENMEEQLVAGARQQKKLHGWDSLVRTLLASVPFSPQD